MNYDDAFEIKKADPDSQYRLLPCKKCKGDNVAYVHYNGRGGAAWRCQCFDCGHTVDKGNKVRHDAQIAWNEDARDKKGSQILVGLLHSRECPFDYKCMATDCVECVKKHMEKGGAEGGKAER